MSGYEGRFEGYADRSSLPLGQAVGGGREDNGRGSTAYNASEDRDSQRQRNSRGSDYERLRTRERDRDQDHHHGDHYKDKSMRDERGRDKLDDYDRHRSHDSYSRHRDNDQDRERRQRHRSRSASRDKSGRNRSRSRSSSQSRRHQDNDQDRERRQRHRSRSDSRDKSGRNRSRSRSSSQSRSKRTSGFDMAPPGPAVAGQQMLGAPQAMPGMFPNMFPFGMPQFGTLPLMPAQAMTQQATRHARRVYVGGLPPSANEQTIATFFSQVMAAIGGNTAGPGDAVVNVYINHEKKFAFVEMRTVEETSNAMALDGIIFEGVSVRVRRPTDYNPALAATLGPSQPNPHLNLSAVGLTPGLTGGVEGPDRIFVGGLPYYFTEAQIRELLESFGSLRGFNLVRDRDTGNSKGYGFCVYQDPAVTDIACAALNGLKMGDKTLTVRRATAGLAQTKPEQENILAQAQQHIAFQKMVLQAGGTPLPGSGLIHGDGVDNPTKVVCLTEVVGADEVRNDEDYEEILEDMMEEGRKFGTLVKVVIPRPDPAGEDTPGVGKVFLEYADINSSTKAKAALHGRKFGGKNVIAIYYPEDKFSDGSYEL